MPPKISHVQIRPSLINRQSGKWYAKEIVSADKPEKTLVFFQRPGQRSLQDRASDKPNGVRSGYKIASKHLTELGVTASCEVRTGSPKGGAPQVSENTLHAFLSDKIETPDAKRPVSPSWRQTSLFCSKDVIGKKQRQVHPVLEQAMAPVHRRHEQGRFHAASENGAVARGRQAQFLG